QFMEFPKKNRRWLHLMFSFPAMLTVVLAALIWILAWGGISDPDIWWHLRNAEYLSHSHQLPSHDMYSFTVAGHDWMNHEWLAEIPFYLAWRADELVGIEILTVALAESIFLGLLYLCYRSSGNFKGSVIACCFCAFL